MTICQQTVGVVVPVRNGAATIATAVESVLAQAVDHVVVVDGQSDDDTLDRIPVDPRIEIVEQRRLGLGAARNEGVDRLDTDLVGFCDADDRWLPGAHASRCRVLTDRPDVVVVAGRVRLTVSTGQVVPRHRRGTAETIVAGYTPGAVLVRRRAVGRFDESLAIASDTGWLARLHHEHGIELIDALVLEKGLGAGTLSTDIATYRSELLTVVKQMVERRRPPGADGSGAP